MKIKPKNPKAVLLQVVVLFLVSFLVLTNCSNKKEKQQQTTVQNPEDTLFTNNPDKFPPIVYSDKFKKSFGVDPVENEIIKAGKLGVKTRKLYTTSFKSDGTVLTRDKLYEEIEFDKNGRRVKHHLYVGVGANPKTWIYKYDSKGNQIYKEVVDSHNNLLASQKSKYDNDGREIESLYFDVHKPANQIIKYFYDVNGNNVKSILLTQKGDTLYKEISVFNSGVMISSKYLNSDGDSLQTIERTYNQATNTFKEVTVTGKVKKTVYYKFDPKGRLIEIKGDTYKREYQYNDAGDVITDQLLGPENELQYEMKYSYLPNGLMSESIRYDSKNRPILKSVYVYEYYNNNASLAQKAGQNKQ
ncbi:hypothetical protein ABRY23_05305 [Melioribacteraceae bacterium 4301-Me]|uniref:hypothetical protein n=1 Tax=Pyranulibacter aquaticus TaxID=3163344 RepID=UPI00359B64F7